MKPAQIWYGWAARGREGTNLEQLIAGSRGFETRTAAIDRDVLPWLRNAHGNAIGWGTRAGASVVFRRTDSGPDVAGRAGAFFTHALIFSETVPRDDLLALYDFPFRDGPLAEPPQALPEVDSLRPGPAAWGPEDPTTVHRLVAALLPSLAMTGAAKVTHGYERQVWAAMSAIVAGLPNRYPAPSFISGEPPPGVKFDVVADLDGHGHLPEAVEPRWAMAAHLLLSEAPADLELKASLAEPARDIQVFLQTLAAWGEIEGELQGKGFDAASRTWREADTSFVTKDIRRVRHLAAVGDVHSALRLAERGQYSPADVLTYAGADDVRSVLPALLDDLNPPASALNLLEGLDLPPQEIGRFVEPWFKRLSAHGQESLSDIQLARVIDYLGHVAPDRAEDALRDLPRAAAEVLLRTGSERLRVRAIVWHPQEILPESLAKALDDPDFTRALLKELTNFPSAQPFVVRAAHKMPPEARLRLIELLVRPPQPRLPDGLWRQLVFEVPETMRPDVYRLVGGTSHLIPHSWAESLLHQFVGDVLAAARAGTALPPAPFHLAGMLKGRSADIWRQISAVRSHLDDRAIDALLKAVGDAPNRDRDAALELACDTIVDRFGSPATLNGVGAAVKKRVASRAGQACDGFLRAAARPSRRDESGAARNALKLVAVVIHTSRPAPPPPAVALAASLNGGDLASVQTLMGQHDLTPQARDWLRSSLGDRAQKRPPEPSAPPPSAGGGKQQRQPATELVVQRAPDNQLLTPPKTGLLSRLLAYYGFGVSRTGAQPQPVEPSPAGFVEPPRRTALLPRSRRVWITVAAAIAVAFAIGWFGGRQGNRDQPSATPTPSGVGVSQRPG